MGGSGSGGKRKGAGRKRRTDGATAQKVVLSAKARFVLEAAQTEMQRIGETTATLSELAERAIVNGLRLALGKAMRARLDAAVKAWEENQTSP